MTRAKKKIKVCPECGGEMIAKVTLGEGHTKFVCKNCGKEDWKLNERSRR